MQKDIDNITLFPSPKTQRGFSSFLDVSIDYILYFNQQTLLLLPRQNKDKISLSLVHLSDVAAARFSSDGKHVASIDIKGNLHICQICPNKLLLANKYEGFYPNANCLDWSADKKRICVVGSNKGKFGRVALVETGTNAGQITGVAGNLNTCSFRPQRPYKLVLGGDQMVLKFFDGPPYNFIKSDKSNTGFINHVRYSPKGSLILVGGADRKLSIYQGTKYQKINEKENAHNGGIYGIDWIDQEHFVSCSSDKLIRIWNTKFQQKFIIQAGTPQQIKNPKAINVFLVAIRIFKQFIYVTNLQGNILVYKNPLLTGQSTLVKTLYGYRNKVSTIIPVGDDNFVILDSGGRILSYSMAANRLVAIKAQIDIKQINNGFLIHHQSSKNLIVLLEDGSLAIYETSSLIQDLKFKKKIQKTQFKYVGSLDSTSIVGISNNNLSLYDLDKQTIIKQIILPQEATFLQSRNKREIFIGTLKGNILVFDLNLQSINKINLATFKISSISTIELQGGENGYLIGDAIGNMKLFKLNHSNNEIQVLKETMGGHSSLITGATYDQKWIYTFSMDGKIHLWNKSSLSRVKQLGQIVKGGIIRCVAIGDKLVVCGDDLTIKIIPKEK